jgi:hypothetical protein
VLTPAPILNPVSAAWNTVARFDDYEHAQRAVDRLSGEGFPVDKLDMLTSSEIADAMRPGPADGTRHGQISRMLSLTRMP